MLVLTRKDKETIVLQHEDGTEVTIQLVSIKDKKARIGITAPVTVRIARGEKVKEPNDRRMVHGTATGD